MTTLVTLLVNLSALTDFDLQPVRKRIYNGCAYAMETAGNLVSAAAEFTAGVQDRENNLYLENAPATYRRWPSAGYRRKGWRSYHLVPYILYA